MIFVGDFVHCPSLGTLEILHDHILDVDAQGFIAYIGPFIAHASQARLAFGDIVRIPKGTFLIPTFYDLHLHAPQFLYQGTGLHLPLMKWLNEYAFKAEEKIDDDPDLAQRVYSRLAHRLREQGTGAVLLFGTIKEETNLILARCMMKAGIRAFVGKLSMDKSSRPSYMEASANDALSAASSFVDKCNLLEHRAQPHEKLVTPVLTPRFVPTCSNELLEGLGRLSDNRGLLVQSHMAESLDQVQWVQSERGVEDMEVFKRSNLLTSRTIQAHCTFLDPDALSHVAEHGTAIAHCPLSNAYFSAEPFRLREALDRGVKVGLGTDIAGGYDISIMSCMRQAVAVSRMRDGARSMLNAATKETNSQEKPLAIDWKEALFLATAGGAQALNLGHGAISFILGAAFDAQSIKLIDENTQKGVGPLDFLDYEFEEIEGWKLSEEMIEKWWCLGDFRNRVNMWIQGRELAHTSNGDN